MRPFYAEYVNHMIRFYITYETTEGVNEFRSEIDKENYFAVKECIGKLSIKKQDIIKKLYSNKENLLQHNIVVLAEQYGVDAKSIWRIIKDLSRDIAQVRKLV